MGWNWTRAALLGALGLVAGSNLGCAEEREPINRVQSDALAKSFFVGKDLVGNEDNPRFYANGTLLDVGYGASQSNLFSAWYANELSIIRWEITEDLLLGRVAYERINDSDGKGAGIETLDGQVLYAFKITGHFDIRRAYNPTTGEESNIIEENTSDSLWYDREYFRVDWSQNLQTDAYDYDLMALLGVLDGVTYTPVSYYINDPKHPHAPKFDPKDGYFDITTKAFAQPAMLDISRLGWGLSSIPACFVEGVVSGGSAPAANCNPMELTIRSSFYKVPDNDYEPREVDGFEFKAAGPFLVERYGFARNYGMSDTKWRRFASRYNIWERSHYYDDLDNMEGAVECFTPDTTPPGASPTRDEDGNGTHDECEAVGQGSKCDEFSQKCTLPYAQRDVRPVLWYYTSGSENRFFESTQWATEEWDVALRMAVMTARYTECNKIGIDNATCDASYPVIKGQSTVMKDAVEVITEVDLCKKDGGSVEDCAGKAGGMLQTRGYDPGDEDYTAIVEMAGMQDMVILCHSPVEANDDPLCGEGKPRLPEGITALDCEAATADGGDTEVRAQCKRAFQVRIGDVRRHQVNVIKSPETPSPWGFGPTFADPLTGEAISASINVWSYPTDLISQFTVDVSRFVGGELETADVTDGTYVKDWTQAAELTSSGKGAVAPMRRAEYQDRIRQSHRAATRDLNSGVEVVDSELARGDIKTDLNMDAVHNYTEKMRHINAAADGTSVMQPLYQARRARAVGTETEAQLTTPAMMQYAGAQKLPSELAMEFSSPMRSYHAADLGNLREMAMAERGACMLNADDFAPSPTAAIGLSKLLQEKFGKFDGSQDESIQLARAERMRNYLAQRMHFAVIVHEMGHTFGYRHNFVSSSSAMFYRPQYWQLRTKNGTVTAKCEDLTESEAEAAACVGPRYFDQVTQEESDNLLQMWTHSSVMDYAGEITQDLLGLGVYDWHAARMFYGDVATVFADEPSTCSGDNCIYTSGGTPSARAAGILGSNFDTFGGIIGYTYQSGATGNIHYSQLNEFYDLIQDCQDIPDPNVFKPSNWDDETQGTWHPTLDGLMVQVDGKYSRCKERRVDYVYYEDLGFPNTEGGVTAGADPNQAGGIGGAFDNRGRMRVPYSFATDRWADLGNLAVYRHDIGADPYELFNFFITEQEVRHIFDNYRRDRQTFDIASAANRVYGRYNTKMRDGAKGLGLQKNFFRDLNLKGAFSNNGTAVFQPDELFEVLVDGAGWNDNLLVATMAFDHFTRQMQRPDPGQHIDNGTGTLIRDDFSENPAVIIPDGPQGFWNNVGIGGKLVANQLAEDQGEFDTDYTINAGSYYDKLNSAILLTESEDNFISSDVDDFTDPRFRSVSMADLFPDGYRRWLANNLTGDEAMKGAHLAANNGSLNIGADLYPSQPIGWTSWWTDSPQVCFPNGGTSVCTDYSQNGAPFKADAPNSTVVVDGQVKWEQQKFLIAWTLVYLPENQKQTWLDMMGIWAVGDDSDPGFANRIELHAPNSELYVARTYGVEDICLGGPCKTVQRGIGARILEWGNTLTEQAYVTTEVTENGVTWFEPVIGPTGAAIVKFDPAVNPISGGTANCGADPDPFDTDYSAFEGCTCNDNIACMQLEDYLSVVDFMRGSMRDFGMASPTMKGIY